MDIERTFDENVYTNVDDGSVIGHITKRIKGGESRR